MPEGFKVADAFVEVGLDDEKVDSGLGRLKGRIAGGIAAMGLGGLLAEGFSQNLDIKQGTAKLQGQLGLTKGVAQSAGKVAGEVYGDNFGGSLEDVNEAIKAVGTNLVDLGTASPAQVKKLSEAALGLASTFGVDVNESTRMASSLVKNHLAPDFESAFDTITKGYQSGLDVAGDFGDTITEYSPQFNKLGIDGPHALSLLSAGLKAGARDTDVIADGFKEFSLRAIDGSKLTAQGFKAIGLDAKDMAAQIAKGGPSAQKATQTTLQALLKIKDPVKQNTAGVALFGTQWEDTFRQILPALAGTTKGMDGVKGSTDAMNTATASAVSPVDAMKRNMEGWLASATQLPGPLGTAGAAAGALGSQGLIAAGAVAQVAPAVGRVAGSAASSAGSIIASGGRIAGSVAATSASMIAGAALQIGRWIAMGVAATANAAVMAAAWLFSIWPIALIIAAVVGLTIVIVKNWSTIKNKTVEIFTAVWHWLQGLWNTVTGWLKAKTLEIVNSIVNHWNSFRAKTMAVFNAVVSWIAGIPGRFMANLARLGALASTLGGYVSRASSAVQSKFNAVVSWVRGIPGRILGALGNLGNLLWNAGSQIIQGLLNGITSKIQAIKNTLSSVTHLIPDWKGPMDVDARLLEPSGDAIMGGLDRALRRGADKVKSTLQGVTRGIPGMVGSPAVALPTGQAVASSGAAGATYSYRDINVSIPAADIREMKDVADFFARIQQEARRQAPGGVRRG